MIFSYSYCSLIISFNDFSHVNKCIQSLTQDPFCTSVLIIDNSSKKETIGALSTLKKHKVKEIIYLDHNLGFANACNLGIRKIHSWGYRFVFLINQDAYLFNSSAKILVETLLHDPQMVICSPIQLSDEKMNLELGFKEHYQNWTQGTFQYPYINAAGWMMDLNKLEKTGLLNPIFFMYGEDDNLCQRISKQGYSIGVCTSAYIVHVRDSKLYFKSLKRSFLKMNGYWTAFVLNPYNPTNRFMFSKKMGYSILNDLAYGRIYKLMGSLLAYIQILWNWKKYLHYKNLQSQQGAFWNG